MMISKKLLLCLSLIMLSEQAFALRIHQKKEQSTCQICQDDDSVCERPIDVSNLLCKEIESFDLKYKWNEKKNEIECSLLYKGNALRDVPTTFCTNDEKKIRYYRDSDGQCYQMADNLPLIVRKVDYTKCFSSPLLIVGGDKYKLDLNNQNNMNKQTIEFLNNTCMAMSHCKALNDQIKKTKIEEMIHVIEKLTQNGSDDAVAIEANKLKVSTRALISSCTDMANSTKLDAVMSLYKDLMSVKKETQEEVRLFHWFDQMESGHLPFGKTNGGNDLRYRAYLSYLQSRYYEKDSEKGGTGLFGRGMYAAIDPHASHEYGGIVAAIKVPKGTPYLVGKNNSVFVSPQTMGHLKNAGCDVEFTETGRAEHFVAKGTLSNNDGCREILNMAYKLTGAKMWSYVFNSSIDCPKRRKDIDRPAFVMTDYQFDSENFKVYDKSLVIENEVETDDPELKLTRKLYQSRYGKGNDKEALKYVFECL